jgi:hypothetical protein
VQDASGDFTANYFSFKNEVYDPVANKWTTKAPMLTSRGDAVSAFEASGVDGHRNSRGCQSAVK